MNRTSPHRCPDCGAPTDKFLCERCAKVCENLTASGEYYKYWVRRYRPSPEGPEASQDGPESRTEPRRKSPRPSLR